jgi:hypothetical protein
VAELENKPSLRIGTLSYDNWRAFNDGEEMLGESEYLMYSDAWLTGEVTDGVGPYKFFNLGPSLEEPGRVWPTIALRLSIHVSYDPPKMDKTDAARYHGGSMTDEIAALASLKCGVRLRSGGLTRRFEVSGDTQGRPVAWSNHRDPELVSFIGTRRLRLPTVTGQHSMMPIQEMKSFPTLAPEHAMGLVRSARLYQNALWLSESEPHLSWLMLVSAVETAANLWHPAKDPPLERLKMARPEFIKYLEGTGVDGLPERIADEFTESIGVTKKFVEFLLQYGPPAPERRPAEWMQILWSPESLSRAFAKVYDYRSKALHMGVPFPAPMCEPAVKWDPSGEAFGEKPIGSAGSISMHGGVWLAKDLPMMLYVFEYIARHALNGWWASLETNDVAH